MWALLQRFIPWLVSAFGILMRSRVGGWIVSALAFLGLSYGVQQFAVGPLVNEIRSYVTGSFSGASLSALGILQFDRCVSIVLSAYGVRYAVAGLKVFLHKRI